MADNYWKRGRRERRGESLSPAMREATGLTRRRFLGVGVAAGAAILAACGSDDDTPSSSSSDTSSNQPSGSTSSGTQATQAAANVTKGGTLTTTQITTDARSFHPYTTNDVPSRDYQNHVYGWGTLAWYDDNLELKPHLAESWTLQDEGRTVVFKIRNGVKWSDGKELTSDDFLFAYENASKPENKWPYISNISEMVSYKAVDPKTIAVTMKEASAVLVENADAFIPLPKHIWEKYDWLDPNKNPEINAPSVALGPWKLKEWRRDNFATFERNPNYFGQVPNLDGFTVRVYGTLALAYQALKAGEVDWTAAQPSDYADAKKQSNLNVHEFYAARGSWDFIGFNMRRPQLKDVNVRKGVAYATDRQGIIESLRYGLGRPTYANYTPTSWAFTDKVEKYEFDTKKAAAAFEAAGYRLNNRRLEKDGQQLSFKILFNTGNVVREGIATVMQQQLTELGARVEVQGMEFQAYLSAIQGEPYDYDLFVLGWSSTIEPHFNHQIWREQSIPALNSGAYVNKQVETLFDQGYKEMDRNKRKEIYGQIQTILANELPYVFLNENKTFRPMQKKVEGVKVTGHDIMRYMNEWHIKQ